jgi:hypothetical protein
MGRVLLTKFVVACAIFAAAPAAGAPLAMGFASPGATGGGSLPLLQPRGELARDLRDGAERASRVVGHPIVFEAPNVKPHMATVFAEAVDRTTRAFEDSVLILNGRVKTITIKRVLFVEGDRPEARLQGDVLRVTVGTRLGLNSPAHEQIFHLLVTQATT